MIIYFIANSFSINFNDKKYCFFLFFFLKILQKYISINLLIIKAKKRWRINKGNNKNKINEHIYLMFKNFF